MQYSNQITIHGHYCTLVRTFENQQTRQITTYQIVQLFRHRPAHLHVLRHTQTHKSAAQRGSDVGCLVCGLIVDLCRRSITTYWRCSLHFVTDYLRRFKGAQLHTLDDGGCGAGQVSCIYADREYTTQARTIRHLLNIRVRVYTNILYIAHR